MVGRLQVSTVASNRQRGVDCWPRLPPITQPFTPGSAPHAISVSPCKTASPWLAYPFEHRRERSLTVVERTARREIRCHPFADAAIGIAKA